MDVRTGRIVNREDIPDGEEEFFIPVDLTDRQRKRQKVGRNEPCPCGSGKKFKNCHLRTGSTGR
jgi:hypothetical protein